MGHRSHTNPLTRKSCQCKICRSGICDQIDQALDEGMPVKDIITFAEKAEPGIDLRKDGIGNHKKKHRFPLIKNKKIISITEGMPKNGTDKEEELSEKHIRSLSSFLDLVIDKVNTAIENGEVMPTVAEGVKAAEIKAKIKEASKFEKELIKFFNEVSTKYGYSS